MTKRLKLLSAVFILITLLSGVAYAEEGGTSSDVSVTAKINAIRVERDLIQKRALEEKRVMQAVRASTTVDVRAKIASTSANVKIQREELKVKIEEKRDDIKARIASTTDRIKERKEEIKSDIEKRIGKKLDEQRTKIAERFEEAMKNLNSLVTRVESRISKIEAEGGNVTSVKASLTIAKANIVLAEADLTTLENMLAESIASSTRKTTIAAIRAQTEKTKTSIKVSHQSIVRVINSLKPGQALKATSTTSVIATTTVQQ